jgi:hemerythrin-like domain-containing protein
VTKDAQYYDGREMQVVHTMFRREFGNLPSLIQAASTSERARAVADHLALIADALHHHHRSEDDVIWPLLERRAGKSVETQVQTMENQHGELSRCLEKLSNSIREWVSGAATTDGSVPARTASRFAELLDEHMAAEEKLVVPFMERHITAAEMDAMVQEATPTGDLAALSLTLGMLMYEGGAESVERPLGRLPADARHAVRSLAADAYSQYAQRLYGTVTPPCSTEVLRPRRN